MSEQVNKEQTKGAEQENITELTDQQLAEAQGGGGRVLENALTEDGDEAALDPPARLQTDRHPASAT